MERLLNATRNSIAGFRHLVRNETAFAQECVLFIVSVPAAWLIAEDVSHFLLLVFFVALMVLVEALNSAIEAVCDAVTTEFNPQIKVAKDAGSLAVFISCIMALFVWSFALISFLVR